MVVVGLLTQEFCFVKLHIGPYFSGGRKWKFTLWSQTEYTYINGDAVSGFVLHMPLKLCNADHATQETKLMNLSAAQRKKVVTFFSRDSRNVFFFLLLRRCAFRYKKYSDKCNFLGSEYFRYLQISGSDRKEHKKYNTKCLRQSTALSTGLDGRSDISYQHYRSY